LYRKKTPNIVGTHTVYGVNKLTILKGGIKKKYSKKESSNSIFNFTLVENAKIPCHLNEWKVRLLLAYRFKMKEIALE
jgi:hypothetical protein